MISVHFPDIVSASDYYPFGSQMVGRSFSTNQYRYGFNGMEKDDELKGEGNSYTTEFRQYDSRLGRWLSIDPMFASFPWQSTYVAFDNNPIYFKDPKGAAAEGGDDNGDDNDDALDNVVVPVIKACIEFVDFIDLLMPTVQGVIEITAGSFGATVDVLGAKLGYYKGSNTVLLKATVSAQEQFSDDPNKTSEPVNAQFYWYGKDNIIKENDVNQFAFIFGSGVSGSRDKNMTTGEYTNMKVVTSLNIIAASTEQTLNISSVDVNNNATVSSQTTAIYWNFGFSGAFGLGVNVSIKIGFDQAKVKDNL